MQTISSGGQLFGNELWDLTVPGDGFAYVALSGMSSLVKVDLSNGAQSSFGTFTSLRGVDSVPAIIPEPSSLVLASLGLIGLGWFGLRRRKK